MPRRAGIAVAILMTAVTTWEEGKLDSTRQEIEGREFWQHMLHCVGD